MCSWTINITSQCEINRQLIVKFAPSKAYFINLRTKARETATQQCDL